MATCAGEEIARSGSNARQASESASDEDVKLPLNKDTDLFEEVKDKPLSNFLSQIINFHGIMPSAEEIKRKKDGKVIESLLLEHFYTFTCTITGGNFKNFLSILKSLKYHRK
jgi:hypothetical protein